MSAGAQISWDETPQAPAQVQWDDEQQKKPEDKPGIATRFTQSLLDNTVGTHTNEGVIEGVTKGIPQIAAHPLNSAAMILDSEAAARQHQLEEAAQLYQEPGIANKIGGFAHHLYGSVPFLGPALGGAADQFEKGDIAGGLGSMTGIAAMTHGGSPEVQENAALAVKTPVKAAVGVVKDVAPDLGAKAGALAKVAGQHAISKIPVVGNMVRRPSLFDYAQAARAKAPVFPGARFPQVPPEGLPPQAPPAVSAPPLVSDTPAPFRLGPGQVPSDTVGAPDPRVLAGNQGVRTTPIALLPESTEAPPVQSPSLTPKLPPPHIELPPRFSPRYDLMEDKAFQDSANADLERHGRRAFKEERDQFEAGNKVDVPKGELTKQFREQIQPEKLSLGWSRPVPVRSTPLSIESLEQARVRGLPLKGLKDDIAANGLKEPIKVKRFSDGKFLIEDGHHRIEALKQLGQKNIPAMVTDVAETRPGKTAAQTERSESAINREIDNLVQQAESRRANANDQQIRGLRPAASDWMTEEELGKLHNLQGELGGNSEYQARNNPELARQRVAAKRASRVGSNAGASADTNYFQAARQALGEKASVSDAAQLAQKLKDSGIAPGASLEELLRKSIELAKQKKK